MVVMVRKKDGKKERRKERKRKKDLPSVLTKRDRKMMVVKVITMISARLYA